MLGRRMDPERRAQLDAWLDKWVLTPIAHVLGWFLTGS
jgi:hypothetical protein